MAPHNLAEQKSTTSSTAGGLLAGVVVFLVLLCLLCLCRRFKAKKKRNATPFRVKGVVRPMAESIPPFSRGKLTASIVMPKKSITREPYAYGLSSSAIVSSERLPTPTSSTPSSHRPRPNVLPAPPRPRVLSIFNPAHPYHTRSSSGFSGYSLYRFLPRLSSRLSFASFVSFSQARPVHQPFEPTLVDELSVRCGEYLSILQNFDDGWCVVARDTSRYSRVSVLSVGMKRNGDNVDIGLVPAWAFTRQHEGVAPSRPFRSTSLNALHLGQNPGYTRDWITSWANFA